MNKRAQWTLAPALVLVGMMVAGIVTGIASMFGPRPVPRLVFVDGAATYTTTVPPVTPLFVGMTAVIAIGLAALAVLTLRQLQSWYGGPTLAALVSIALGPVLYWLVFVGQGLRATEEAALPLSDMIAFTVVLLTPVVATLIQHMAARRRSI